MGLWRILSGLDGRINRRLYWICVLQCAIIECVALVLIIVLASSEILARPILFVPVGLLALFVAWTGAALSVKRLHDRDKSAHFVWLLIVLPLILEGAAETTNLKLLFVPALLLNLWALIEIGFLPGTIGDNRFGPDPLAIG
ncbi:MAG: DUF805 domain-containing protein [Hyphomicrobiales bacterium]